MSRSVSGTTAPTSWRVTRSGRKGTGGGEELGEEGEVVGVVVAGGRVARGRRVLRGGQRAGIDGDDRRVLGERADDVVALAAAGEQDGGHGCGPRQPPVAPLYRPRPEASIITVRHRISKSRRHERC